jgi:uncharacterized delta-60 repeat protein
MVVARLTPGGLLDRRFGKAGIAQVLFWNANQAASAGATGLTIAPGGGVIASGHLDSIGTDGHGSAGLFRLSSSGRLVSGFGTGGHVEVPFTNASGRFAQWFPCALTLDASGRLTVTGDGGLPGAGAQLLSARLTSNGALDHSFGTGGRAVTSGLSDDNSTTCGAYASAGRLTVGVGPTIVRLKPNGAPDSGFARGGVLTVRVPANVTVNAAIASPAPASSSSPDRRAMTSTSGAFWRPRDIRTQLDRVEKREHRLRFSTTFRSGSPARGQAAVRVDHRRLRGGSAA